MKKTAFLLLILVIFIGHSAFCQDTLRLFGHKEKQKTQPVPDTVVETHPAKYTSSSEIQTLTGPGRNVGFFFGFHSEYSQVAGYDAFGAGGTFALVANHGLAIGFSGKGFFAEPYKELPASNISYSYTGGYGGIYIEPILFPKYPVHLSFPIILGAGGIARSILTDYNYPYDHTEMYVEDAETFLIAEPGVEIEFNVTRWMRLGLGGSYRFTTAIESTGYETNPLDGFTAGFSFKFGKF
jgi:hypothetical protein